MILKELINKSIYGVIGYISSIEDLNNLERYIIYNKDILNLFKRIVVATNYSSFYEFKNLNTQLWKKYFPNSHLIDLPVNRGYQVGTTDLDNALFNYCKDKNEIWLCKSASDIILDFSILEIEIPDSDFYYLNGIGYGGMRDKWNFNLDNILDNLFYPQTNFYFLNVSKTDYLVDIEHLNKVYNEMVIPKGFNGNIQALLQGYGCEINLAQTVGRNKLNKYHLIPRDKFKKLLHTVKSYNIHDPSHKNIMISGICHYHYIDQPIIKI